MDFILDVHCHTLASGHAYSTVAECMAEAARKQLKLVAITDHAPTLEGAPTSIYFANLLVLPDYVDGVELLRGTELNILDKTGAVDLDEQVLSTLDIVIASMHPPVFKPDTEQAHTQALLAVMENPYVDILGHLGDRRFPFDIELITETAARTNTIIELNNTSFNPRGIRAGGDDIVKEIVRGCIKAGTKLVLGSDAHYLGDVGNFCYLRPLVEELNVPEELILNTSVEKLKAALHAKRERPWTS